MADTSLIGREFLARAATPQSTDANIRVWDLSDGSNRTKPPFRDVSNSKVRLGYECVAYLVVSCRPFVSPRLLESSLKR